MILQLVCLERGEGMVRGINLNITLWINSDADLAS